MNQTTVTTLAISILAAVGGGVLAAIVTGMFARGKTKAEAESIATNTTLLIIKDLRDEVGRLAARLRESEKECEVIRHYAEAAEERAAKSEYDVLILSLGMRACTDRISFLTKLLEDNGIQAGSWTPPKNIEVKRNDVTNPDRT